MITQTSYSHQRNFATIPEAKREGAIDRIENGETKLKSREHELYRVNRYTTNIFDRTLEYTGKFVSM